MAKRNKAAITRHVIGYRVSVFASFRAMDAVRVRDFLVADEKPGGLLAATAAAAFYREEVAARDEHRRADPLEETHVKIDYLWSGPEVA